MEAVLVALSGRLFDQKLKALIKGCVLTLGALVWLLSFPSLNLTERNAARL